MLMNFLSFSLFLVRFFFLFAALNWALFLAIKRRIHSLLRGEPQGRDSRVSWGSEFLIDDEEVEDVHPFRLEDEDAALFVTEPFVPLASTRLAA